MSRRPTILIVDDEAEVRRSLTRLLRRHGYDTCHAASASQALDVIERNPELRLVVTDFRMPGMTGTELATKLKAQQPDIQILLLSGYADLNEVVAAFNEQSIQRFLTKPWDNEELLSALDTLQQALVDSEKRGSGNPALVARSGLLQQIDRELANGGDVTVFHLDILEFHAVNALVGYEGGDLVLRAIGERLCAGKPDDAQIAHLRGDEFALLLPQRLEPTAIDEVLSSWLTAFDDSFEVDGFEMNLSARVGYVLGPEDGLAAELLLRNAATAVHLAKNSATGSVMRYRASEDERKRETNLIAKELKAAIANGQLSLVYQPKIRLSDGRIVGGEALMRWQHPVLGTIPPSVFIPIAENSDIILTISRWLVQQVKSQAALWQGMGVPPFHIAVNLSGAQLESQEGFDMVRQAAGSSDWLEFELTETFMMNDVDLGVTRLTELKSLGFQLAMDDFGTGYSSLSNLSKMNLDILKIDRSFIKDITDNPHHHALVSYTIKMAHALGLVVVAEGVETEAQLQHLQRLNCDVIQGFYFSPPVDAEAFGRMIQEQPFEGGLCVS